MGRLIRDPELRKAGEASVSSFRISCDRDFKNKDGQVETDFIDIAAWRNLAETVSKYFSKGRMAVVCGRLQIKEWTDREGVKRSTPEVVAEHIYFGDSKPKNGEPCVTGGGNDRNNTSGYNAPPDGFIPNFGDEDGDLPF